MTFQTLCDLFVRNISNLYDKADDYNVKIQVGEGTEMEIFKAHSVILRARSTYFCSALSSDWAKKEGDFFIFMKPNVTPTVFQIILKYIYTGTIALDTTNVKNHLIELLIAVDEMNFHELAELLQQHISYLDHDWIVQNGVKLYDTISQKKGVFLILEEFCNDVMGKDPKLLINSSELWGLNEEDLLSIIKLDNLNMREIEIWENLIKWGITKNSSTLNFDMTNWDLNDYETLKTTLSKYIQHIRFFQMTPEEYYYKVRPLGKLLPKELEEDLSLYYIITDCKLSTKVLPPRSAQLESSILIKKHFNLISYWIDNGQENLPKFLESSQYKFKLLLRGSEDGFESSNFRSKCCNKGATIIIIKLNNSDKIIGGYNPITWGCSRTFIKSDKSFIFSFYINSILDSRTILSRVKNSEYAILDNSTGFGNSDLLVFQKRCKLMNYSVKIHDSETFEVDDYEVFQVVKQQE